MIVRLSSLHDRESALRDPAHAHRALPLSAPLPDPSFPIFAIAEKRVTAIHTSITIVHTIRAAAGASIWVFMALISPLLEERLGGGEFDCQLKRNCARALASAASTLRKLTRVHVAAGQDDDRRAIQLALPDNAAANATAPPGSSTRRRLAKAKRCASRTSSSVTRRPWSHRCFSTAKLIGLVWKVCKASQAVGGGVVADRLDFAGLDRATDIVPALWLHGNDLGVRAGEGKPGRQSAAAATGKDAGGGRRALLVQLRENFDPGAALSFYHPWIGEGVDIGRILLRCEALRDLFAVLCHADHR